MYYSLSHGLYQIQITFLKGVGLGKSRMKSSHSVDINLPDAQIWITLQL